MTPSEDCIAFINDPTFYWAVTAMVDVHTVGLLSINPLNLPAIVSYPTHPHPKIDEGHKNALAQIRTRVCSVPSDRDNHQAIALRMRGQVVSLHRLKVIKTLVQRRTCIKTKKETLYDMNWLFKKNWLKIFQNVGQVGKVIDIYGQVQFDRKMIMKRKVTREYFYIGSYLS